MNTDSELSNCKIIDMEAETTEISTRVNEEESLENELFDSDDDFDDFYYDINENINVNGINNNGDENLESFDYRCINYDQAKLVLESTIKNITNNTQLNYSLAKMLLIQNKWDLNEIMNKYFLGDNDFFHSKGIKPRHITFDQLIELCQTGVSFLSPNQDHLKQDSNPSQSEMITCNVCLEQNLKKNFISLICNHSYCLECWRNHLQVNIENNQSINICCMRTDCKLFLPEDSVHFILKSNPLLKQQYDLLSFRASIDSYNRMKHCINCSTVIEAQDQPEPKRVQCSNCKSSFCFQCGHDYHAPTDCKTIILWHRKCADDSETANYIVANTKNCPSCSSCIEKNGGCNHMFCYSCHHEFCWICLKPWNSTHFRACAVYTENDDVITESERAKEALKKYLFYYERWANHMKSLKFEDENLHKIKTNIEKQLECNNGSWIDWQYLLRGAEVLSKCRYTLQYTYPYAYYMESGPEKELFEYQQAELENEIENLSWKIDHATTSDHGDLENQMTIVEKRRTTLLCNFFQY